MSTTRLWVALASFTTAACLGVFAVYLWTSASRDAAKPFATTTPDRGPAYLAFAAAALAIITGVIVLSTAHQE